MTWIPFDRSYLHSAKIALGLVGFLLTSCRGIESSSPSASQILVGNIARQQILVDLATFSEHVMALRKEAAAFCEDPNEDGLVTLRAAWQESSEAWFRLQIFNFGPADLDPVFPLFSFIDSLRVRGNDYRDSARLTIDGWLASDETLSGDFFAEQRFNDVGLVALEVLLFDSDDLASRDEPRACPILEGLTIELERRVRELERGWEEDYDGSGRGFVDLLEERTLPNGRYPLVQIVISAQQYLDYLHRRRVVAIAGQLAGASWLFMESAVDGIDDLLSAELEGGNIFYYMAELGDPSSVEKVRGDIEGIRDALAAEDPDALEQALAVLDGDFKREIPDALGIDLGLTLTDGD